MATDNVQYKDRLFNFLFGSEENKEWTLSLWVNTPGWLMRSEETIQQMMKTA